MILGNPANGEIYGYSHVSPRGAVIFLRNPDLESRELDLTPATMRLAGTDELTRSSSVTAFEVYPTYREIDGANPATSPIKLQVLGSETKIIAITSDPELIARLKL